MIMQFCAGHVDFLFTYHPWIQIKTRQTSRFQYISLAKQFQLCTPAASAEAWNANSNSHFSPSERTQIVSKRRESSKKCSSLQTEFVCGHTPALSKMRSRRHRTVRACSSHTKTLEFHSLHLVQSAT